MYSTDIEENLLAQRRDWIQVTGNVVLDAAGNPKRVTDVEEVRPLDLSPIELKDFPDDESGSTLRFVKPFSLTPTQDSTRQVLLLDYEPLNIHVHAMTREELEDALYGLIWVLWDDYTQTQDADLTAPARDFKARLQEAIQEVPLAAR